MANPKKTEEKIERMINAWRTLAPAKSFGGMTLAQFEAVAAPCTAARQRIDALDAQRVEACSQRDDADDVFEDKAKLVVAGVRADPTEGPDSPLYEAFGYTPDSERKTGLTPANAPTPPPPKPEPAARVPDSLEPSRARAPAFSRLCLELGLSLSVLTAPVSGSGFQRLNERGSSGASRHQPSFLTKIVYASSFG